MSIPHFIRALLVYFYYTTAVLISLINGNLVNVKESESTITLHLAVTGFSFGEIPFHVAPMSYSQFEELRMKLNISSSLREIFSFPITLPSESALPCK